MKSIYLYIFNKRSGLQSTCIQSFSQNMTKCFCLENDEASTCQSMHGFTHERPSPHTPSPPPSGWRRVKSLASLVHSHFHTHPLSRSQPLPAMITSEVFSCFVFYGALLVIKMYIVAIITGQVRLRKKVSLWAGRTAGKKVITLRLYNLFLPNQGFRQPGGRSEARRTAVPPGGSVCGEMPEVE